MTKRDKSKIFISDMGILSPERISILPSKDNIFYGFGRDSKSSFEDLFIKVEKVDFDKQALQNVIKQMAYMEELTLSEGFSWVICLEVEGGGRR